MLLISAASHVLLLSMVLMTVDKVVREHLLLVIASSALIIMHSLMLRHYIKVITSTEMTSWNISDVIWCKVRSLEMLTSV